MDLAYGDRSFKQCTIGVLLSESRGFMYMREGAIPEGVSEEDNQLPGFAVAGLAGTAVAVLYLGIFPETLLNLATDSISALL